MCIMEPPLPTVGVRESTPVTARDVLWYALGLLTVLVPWSWAQVAAYCNARRERDRMTLGVDRRKP